MNFLKKLTGGKSAKDTAMSAAKSAGLDPAVIMPKIFSYFCGGQKDGSGKPAMDFSKLLAFAKQTGIMDKLGGKKIDAGTLKSIFSSVAGGGGGDAAPAADDAGAGGGDPKGTMNYDDFQKGVTKIAEKKYEDEGIKGDKAKSKLEAQIISDNDVSDWME